MLPHTSVAYDTNSLLELISQYNLAGIKDVVLKRDRKNGGLGIHRFSSIEEVYNFAAFCNLEYPLVLQPFVEEFKDIRVILLGDHYTEAYERINQANFRHNLHCGGSASPYKMSEEMHQFCRKVMSRGRFPYAHIDLMQMSSGVIHLIEINLRGGLRGAKIDSRSYQETIDKLHKQLLTTEKVALS